MTAIDTMITPDQIAVYLQECLPSLTDRFHDQLPVASGLVSGGILTITFPDPHGLLVGEEILVNKALIRNEIVNVITNSDDTISYITQNVHDLTSFRSDGHGGTWPEGLTQVININGIDTTINLINDPSAVPHETEFVGEVGSPTFTPAGNDFLLEDRAIGVKGFKDVATVPTTTTITIDLSDVPSIPDGPLVIDNVITSIRVTQVADIERARELYTNLPEQKAWLFIIMLDRTASKNRQNEDDFVSLPASTKKMLSIRQEFSTLVIVPTANNLGAGDVKSWTYVDLFAILNTCLYGWRGTGYTSDGQAEYNTGYYSHAYEWEARIDIDFTDGFENGKTVALRKLIFTQTVFDKGESSGEIDYPE